MPSSGRKVFKLYSFPAGEEPSRGGAPCSPETMALESKHYVVNGWQEGLGIGRHWPAHTRFLAGVAMFIFPYTEGSNHIKE